MYKNKTSNILERKNAGKKQTNIIDDLFILVPRMLNEKFDCALDIVTALGTDTANDPWVFCDVVEIHF